MPNTVPFVRDTAKKAADAQAPSAVLDAVRTLVGTLSVQDKNRLLEELTEIIRPMSAPRAGEVLGTLIRLLPERREWTVDQIKSKVAESGVSAAPKEIYNAISYLARKGQMQRVAYGRYMLNGMEVVTSDDYGGQTTRNEDEYRTDRSSGD